MNQTPHLQTLLLEVVSDTRLQYLISAYRRLNHTNKRLLIRLCTTLTRSN